jgi:peptidoglycan hydrolase-like protein with peptidoglycan-binding domain
MVYSLIWLSEVLRDAGLKVAETNGWASRGRGEMNRVRGIMCHHTGSAGSGNMPTLNMLIAGRGGAHPLSGPLAQLGLGCDGTYYIIAAGRANHAGEGIWGGVTSGNASFIGIEAENAGTPGAVWPDWQMDAYRRGVAALLKHIGAGSEMCCGHKEYALPKGRKPDPLFDMNDFRDGVRNLMRGTGAIRPIIPLVDPSGKMTLERGARGDDVKRVQVKVGVSADGKFDATTEAAVRRFQADHGLRPDGIVGPATWAVI